MVMKEEAKKELQGLIRGKTLTIIPKAVSYHRLVAEVKVGRVNVNKAMKKRGY